MLKCSVAQNQVFIKTEINKLQQENEKLKKSYKDKEDTLHKINLENKNKEYQIKNNNIKLNELLSKKDEEISKLKEKNQLISKNQDNYQNLLGEQKNKIKNLEQAINNFNSKMGNYQKIKDEISQKSNALKNREKELDNKISNMKEMEKEYNKKISFLEDKENLIDNEYKNIEKEKKELQKNKIDNTKLKNEYNALKQKYIQLLEKNNNKHHIKNSLSTEEMKGIIDKNKNNFQSQQNNNFDNNLQNAIVPNNNKGPLILYKKPTLIGLNNIGATCFMNSTLQCLSQTKALTNFFLDDKNKEKIINNNIAMKNKNEHQLSPDYLELIKILWKINGEKSYSPYPFMHKVNDMNPLFKTGQAGDSKDFIIFVLEQLHKELKKSVNKNKPKNQQPLNQYDKNNAFNYFFNDFTNECSIISDVFFGFTETTNECLNCKNKFNSQGMNNPICYNYGIFNCLIFPLEEVKNMKNNSIQYNNNQININRVSLYECFYYNQKSELFTGENRNYCNICKQLFDSIYTSKIYISPNVLVLILNRGKGNIYDVKLDFSEIIDITQFVMNKDVPQLIYNLYGVITHIGESGPNAHFVASCKSPIDNKWYRYNDAFVNPITNIQKEVIEFGTPYILFYQKNSS